MERESNGCGVLENNIIQQSYKIRNLNMGELLSVNPIANRSFILSKIQRFTKSFLVVIMECVL